ncbi:MAG: sulfate adenylyltransferase [Spirochaeta sp.]|nr:sulfate adenylyltransferase [Spirochaeta sp.]RPG09032.1 MAG: sulfate adenylyltransferase [Proteobacteria bacterium TMED72]
MSEGNSPDLVPVHGGLSHPVDRMVPLNERTAFLAEAEALPSVVVTAADLSTVYRIADGALSPLEGPMKQAEFQQVLDHSVVTRGGRDFAWTIPLSLPVTDSEAGAIAAGGSVAVRTEDGELVAIVDEAEVFAWDKPAYVQSVYGTDRFDHPGGRMVENDERSQLLGGPIRVLPQPQNMEYGEFMLSPRQVRELIRGRKWQRALAFQTRNPLHRAHEYALVAGVEDLTSAGHFTGAVLNPLVGELKGDDVPASVRMRCYRELHSKQLLGQGDKDPAIWDKAGYDISEIFELVGLDMKMFYGGPKEAVMHGIYRQNYGFSDIVIGRKHADAPFEGGEAIWGDFDAHEVFDTLAGELEIQPCKIGFAAYYESLGRVDLTERHPDEKPFSISGTKVREQLAEGDRPDARIMRSETADVLIEAYRG